MPDAFYLSDGAAFISTEATEGPWSPTEQHAGPPAALLARALERCEAREDLRIARITIEILRAIPVAPVRVEAAVARPGRSVEMLEGSLFSGDDEVLRARAWRIRTGTAPETIDEEPPGSPETSAEPRFFDFGPRGLPGYFRSMEWRFARGQFDEPGPASAWMRMRVPLVAGEEPSGLQRVLVAADSGNGISSIVQPLEWIFVNTDLTVTLTRYPVGEWVNLDAVTRISGDGIGMADTRLWDERGRIGRGTQTLLVRERG